MANMPAIRAVGSLDQTHRPSKKGHSLPRRINSLPADEKSLPGEMNSLPALHSEFGATLRNCRAN
jgi:hypothetical protein